MDPPQAQEIYNFSELTPEAQQMLFTLGLGFDEAAQRLAIATSTDIGTVRHELIKSAAHRAEVFSAMDISVYWLMMKVSLSKWEREGSIA